MIGVQSVTKLVVEIERSGLGSGSRGQARGGIIASWYLGRLAPRARARPVGHITLPLG